MEFNIFRLNDTYEHVVKEYLINPEMDVIYEKCFYTDEVNFDDIYNEEELTDYKKDMNDFEKFSTISESSFFMKMNRNEDAIIKWGKYFNELASKSSLVNVTKKISEMRITETPFGIYLFKMSNNHVYAITVGYTSQYISQYANYDFGLDIAERILCEQSIDVKGEKHINAAKKRTITTYSAEAFDSISFGSAEDFLKGRIILDRITNANVRAITSKLFSIVDADLSFGVSIKVKNKRNENIEFEKLAELIILLDIYCSVYKDDTYVNHAIPRLTYVNPNGMINGQLTKKLLEMIEKNDFNVGIDFYSVVGADIEITNVDVGVLRCPGEGHLKYDNLTIQDIKEFINTFKSDKFMSLKKTTVEFNNNKSRSLLKILTADINYNGSEYILVNGRWAFYNKTFNKYIDEQMQEILNQKIVENKSGKYNCTVDELSKYLDDNYNKINPKYKEFVYNKRLETEEHLVCLDREMGMIDNYNVEVADLYDKNELIHVKIGDVGKFIENIEQSLLAASIMVDANHIKQFNKHHLVKNKIKRNFRVTLLLVLENNKDISKFDISKVKSIKFKSYLIGWYQTILDLKLEPSIKIANIDTNGTTFKKATAPIIEKYKDIEDKEAKLLDTKNK